MALEDRIKVFIGQVVFSNLQLVEQVNEAQARIAALENQLKDSAADQQATPGE